MVRLISPIKTNLDQIFLIQMFLFLDFQAWIIKSQMGDFTLNTKIILNQSLEFSHSCLGAYCLLFVDGLDNQNGLLSLLCQHGPLRFSPVKTTADRSLLIIIDDLFW